MENTQRVLVLSIIAISIFASVSHAETESYWEGALSYRGSEMSIRLQFYPVADTLQVELDIPSMLMAWKPIPGSQTKSGISVELPFGIGKLSIAFDGDQTQFLVSGVVQVDDVQAAVSVVVRIEVINRTVFGIDVPGLAGIDWVKDSVVA